MEPWNFSQEETEESSTLILLNCFTVFIRVYGKGLWKCDLAYNRAGVLPILSLMAYFCNYYKKRKEITLFPFELYFYYSATPLLIIEGVYESLL